VATGSASAHTLLRIGQPKNFVSRIDCATRPKGSDVQRCKLGPPAPVTVFPTPCSAESRLARRLVEDAFRQHLEVSQDFLRTSVKKALSKCAIPVGLLVGRGDFYDANSNLRRSEHGSQDRDEGAAIHYSIT